MSLTLWIIGSVVVVSLISLIGIIALSMKQQFLSKFLLVLVSLSAGTLFGDALLHLLPEAVEEGGFTPLVSLSTLLGIVAFFVVEKLIHMHLRCQPQKMHSPHKYPLVHEPHKHHLGFMNILGDGLHNFIDGLIIAASFFVNIPVGIATTIAVILHEIPQELADFGVLIYSGFSKNKAILVNFFTATTAILGAILGIVISNSSELFLKLSIPFAAGGFIYIAGANLIPELHKDCKWKSSILHFAALIAGILIMYGLLFIE